MFFNCLVVIEKYLHFGLSKMRKSEQNWERFNHDYEITVLFLQSIMISIIDRTELNFMTIVAYYYQRIILLCCFSGQNKKSFNTFNCSSSIPPENVRNPLVSQRFHGW